MTTNYPTLAWTDGAAPQADVRTTSITQHDITRTEDYAWLRDDNWQAVMQDPAQLDGQIRSYLEAENAYLDRVMAPTKALQGELYEEMRGRLKEDDSGIPTKDGKFGYFSRYQTGAQYPQVVRVPWSSSLFDPAATQPEPEVLFDGPAEAEGQPYFAAGAVAHSPDHKLLAVALDCKGSEYYGLEVREIATGKVLSTGIDNCSGAVEWTADSKALIYTTLDENHRPAKVLCHRIGTDPSNDILLFEELDAGFFVGISKSESGAFIFVSSHQHDSNEVRLIDAKAYDSVSEPLRPRESGIEYDLAHQGKKFLIRTNLNGAIDYKIMSTPIESPFSDSWRELIEHHPGRSIVDVTVTARHMIRLERSNALPSIVVMDMQSGDEHSIAMDEEAYALGLGGGYEFDTSNLRYSYTSPTTPARTYDYDMDSRVATLRKEQEVPSGHDSENYVTKRWSVTASDGAEIPVTALYHQDTVLNGSAPVLLYGYGSYGMAMPASFSTGRLSLVDRGFIYVVAHIRGGSERGDDWYKQGRHKTKVNSFTDFIAVGDDLVSRGWTKPGRIACHGGSAGGLLVGAVVNMRPELFGACVGQVPFVDVLTTISDASLPLTPIEWPEWGNPIESIEDYKLIASYSPIDNVTTQVYPPILATGGLTDPRVTYWEPAKWIATLRARSQNANRCLLKINMDAGHGGASGRFDNLKETALIFAFLLSLLGGKQG